MSPIFGVWYNFEEIAPIGNVTDLSLIIGTLFEVKASTTFNVITHPFLNQLQSNFAHYFL